MALESATYIDGLVVTNPLGSDPLADADGHLRLVKTTLKATFPNITGPVTATQASLNSPFPSGGIIMWSGSLATIPSGWLLCNGDSSTPDLRDRFIVGAGLAYAVDATGGAATVALSTAELPSHTHTFSGSGTTGNAGGHSHSINDPGHLHDRGRQPLGSADGGNPNLGNVNGNTASAFTGISINAVGDHAHSVSVSGTTGALGSGTAHENRPPYYALAYIMKV